MKAAKTKTKKESSTQSSSHEALLETLQARFEKNPKRHSSIEWAKVKARLEARPEKLAVLARMEATEGEPDVVGQDTKSGEFLFVDCAAQSPEARASLCYDREALDSRKEHKPKSSVLDVAAEIGVEVLSEEQYFDLQKLGEFDTKSSSWLRTPADIRKLGGAIYGDRRYNRVFISHNGAQSYYSGRGFRGMLRV